MREIYSLEHEANIIAGILKNSEYYYEVNSFLTEDDFYSESHKIIFSVLLQMINNKEVVDKLNVAQRVKDLGITLSDIGDAFAYLRALNVRQINLDGFISNVKELKKLSIRRRLRQDFINAAKEIENATALSYNEIIAKAEESFNSTINIYNRDDEPIDLFSGIKEEIEEIGNNPVEEIGLSLPYPTFNKLFGGACPGELYVIAGNAKGGKSTILSDIARKICTECNLDRIIKVLILDTEMSSKKIRFRNIAGLSGVSDWAIKTGSWRKNKELTEKVRTVWNSIDKYYNKINHIYVGDKGIDEVLSICRRWKHKNVKEGEFFAIIFDYLKTGSEAISTAHPEHYVIGNKCMKMKNLATELNGPVFCGVQLNRMGQAALSQRISWFCSFLFHIEKWTPEERALWGDGKGTHKLMAKFTRDLGQYGEEANKLVQYVDGGGETQIVEDWINLDFNNFNVEDKGTLSEMLTPKLQLVSNFNPNDGVLLD